MKRAFVAVEGPQDIELIGALLRSLLPKRKRITRHADVDPFWDVLIPKSFPHEGELRRPVPLPVFFAADERAVAVMSATGDSGLADAVQTALDALDETPDAIGVVMDADDVAPGERWSMFRATKGAADFAAWLPETPGVVRAGPPRAGGFVLPDCQSPGTLEELLIDAAEVVYPDLLSAARGYVDGARAIAAALPKKERAFFQKPAGAKKATIAAVGSVLRPGMSIHNALHQNRWLKSAAVFETPRIAAARSWLAELLDVPD